MTVARLSCHTYVHAYIGSYLAQNIRQSVMETSRDFKDYISPINMVAIVSTLYSI